MTKKHKIIIIDKMTKKGVESADPEGYVKQKFQGKDVSYEKTVLEDGTIIFDIQTSMIRQRCSFTEI